jgi:hypothetical protein
MDLPRENQGVRLDRVRPDTPGGGSDKLRELVMIGMCRPARNSPKRPFEPPKRVRNVFT